MTEIPVRQWMQSLPEETICFAELGDLYYHMQYDANGRRRCNLRRRLDAGEVKDFIESGRAELRRHVSSGVIAIICDEATRVLFKLRFGF